MGFKEEANEIKEAADAAQGALSNPLVKWVVIAVLAIAAIVAIGIFW